MEKLNIGLFGFGVVGEGIYKVLTNKNNLGWSVKKIAIKDPNKIRNAPSSLFTTNAEYWTEAGMKGYGEYAWAESYWEGLDLKKERADALARGGYSSLECLVDGTVTVIRELTEDEFVDYSDDYW